MDKKHVYLKKHGLVVFCAILVCFTVYFLVERPWQPDDSIDTPVQNQDSNETESGEEILTDSVENRYGETAVTEKEFYNEIIHIDEDHLQSNGKTEEDQSSFEVKEKSKPTFSDKDYDTVEASGDFDKAYFDHEEYEDDIEDKEHIFSKIETDLREINPILTEEETSLVGEEIIHTEEESVSDYHDYNMMNGFK